MRITSLLGVIAIIALIVMPAISQPSLKECPCRPDNCHGKPIESCCSKISDECLSSGCACLVQFAPYSGMEYCDPSNLSFSKSSARPTTRTSPDGRICSNHIGLSFSMFPVDINGAGPPDPDVVEFLPPSAKQVFQVLASEGPLTQKDIISRTDLPPRTVRYALGRLRGEEMLEERFCFSDARQSLYSLIGTTGR